MLEAEAAVLTSGRLGSTAKQWEVCPQWKADIKTAGSNSASSSQDRDRFSQLVQELLDELRKKEERFEQSGKESGA